MSKTDHRHDTRKPFFILAAWNSLRVPLIATGVLLYLNNPAGPSDKWISSGRPPSDTDPSKPLPKEIAVGKEARAEVGRMRVARFGYLKLVAEPGMHAADANAGQAESRADLYGDPLPPGAIGRFGTTRLRHGAWTRAAAFLPDGKTLASVDDDGTVYLWDAATGKERTHYRVGPGPAAAVTFSPDQRLIAWSNGHEVRLYDLATGKRLHQHGATPKNDVQGNLQALRGFSGDSRIMASASANRRQVQLWEVGTGKELRTLDMHDALAPEPGRSAGELRPDAPVLALSPDGTLLVTTSPLANPAVAVWSTFTGKRLYGLPFSQAALPLFAPDGKTLAAISITQKQVVLCEAATGEKRHTFFVGGAVRCLAFAPDGKTLAAFESTGRRADRIRIWDVGSHEMVRLLKVTALPAQTPADGNNARFAFSGDGRRLVFAVEAGQSQAILHLWALPAGKELLRLMLPSGQAWPLTSYVWTAPVNCALAADGATLAVTRGSSVRLWDTATGKELHAQPGHHAYATELAVSRDGRQVATGGPDGMIHLWDATTHKERARWRDNGNSSPLLAFAADGKILTSCRNFGDSAILWELPAAREVRRQQQAPQGSAIRALSRDGRAVAWITQEGLVSLLDPATDKEHIRLATAWDQRQQTWNQRAVFSPDGKRFATVALAANGASILQWDVVTGRKLPTVARLEPTVGALAYSADGRMVAVLNRNDREDIRLWEVASGKPCLRIKGPGGAMPSLAFSPDGRRFAVGFADGSIRTWDLATGKPLGHLDGHRGTVWSLQFAPDGKRLYSASADTTVLIWDMTRSSPPLAGLSPADLDRAWADLADDDAAKAYRAIWTLAGAPKQGSPFLNGRLNEAIPTDKQIRRWIGELDSDDFDTRQAAVKELTRRGEWIELAALAALKGKVSLEVRRRLEQLLKTIQQAPPPELLRVLRALQVLELIGSAEAQIVLQALARGPAGARQTREAQDSLDRLARRAAGVADR